MFSINMADDELLGFHWPFWINWKSWKNISGISFRISITATVFLWLLSVVGILEMKAVWMTELC